MKLKGKRAIITGASMGLGKEIAKQFLKEGASVVICSRGESPLKETFNELNNLVSNEQSLFSKVVDISNQEDVKSLVDFSNEKLKGIDILVCNAGVYGPKGPFEENKWEDWIEAAQINLFGTVLTCRGVVPLFKQQRAGKIIVLSGGGATKPLPNLSSYAATKAGVVRFAETISEELKEFGIDVNTVAPGALNTRMLDEVLQAGPGKVGEAFYNSALKQQENGGAPLEKGASLCVYLGSNESDGVTGKLISALWDPWRNFADKRNELKASDVYTLRRIVPQERGFNWEEGLQ